MKRMTQGVVHRRVLQGRAGLKTGAGVNGVGLKRVVSIGCRRSWTSPEVCLPAMVTRHPDLRDPPGLAHAFPAV
jgi:hypothetical protein